jgi:hypothetical protein
MALEAERGGSLFLLIQADARTARRLTSALGNLMSIERPVLKEIAYRGGLITFQVPACWVEEYGHDGGGCFYEEVDGSGTLRLDTLTAQAPSPITVTQAIEVLSILPGSMESAPIEQLASGYALSCYSESTIERGQKLHITYWVLAQVIPPNNVRIAYFSYTLLSGQELEPKFKDQIQLIDTEIRKSNFWPLTSQDGA